MEVPVDGEVVAGEAIQIPVLSKNIAIPPAGVHSASGC